MKGSKKDILQRIIELIQRYSSPKVYLIVFWLLTEASKARLLIVMKYLIYRRHENSVLPCIYA